MNASQLRKRAAGDRREAARLRAAAAERLRLADTLEKLATELEEAAEALTNTQQDRSMLGSKMEMERAAPNKRVKIAAAMTEDASEAKRALLEAGLTPQDVATKRKVGRSTVDAWCRGTRPIPRAHREWLKTEHGIPYRVWLKQAD